MQQITNLAKRLKLQIKQENETIQNLTRKQLDALRSELSSIFQQSLNTIEEDIRTHHQAIIKPLLRHWLWPNIACLCLLLAIAGIGLSMTLYYQSQISHQREQISHQRETIGKLNRKGGKAGTELCGQRLCVQIDMKAPHYTSGYRILKGY